MHLSEGVLAYSTLISGGVFSAIGTYWGLKQLNDKQLPLTALFGAVFFVASTIHIPVGIGSVHLILNGLAGLLLGWSVFPAFLIALTLQALLFSFGGMSVLGTNLLIMALPAVFAHYLLRSQLEKTLTKKRLIMIGAACGIIGVGGGALLASAVLTVDNGKAYFPLIQLLILSHIPVFILDSIISSAILLSLHKMKPELLKLAIR